MNPQNNEIKNKADRLTITLDKINKEVERLEITLKQLETFSLKGRNMILSNAIKAKLERLNALKLKLAKARLELTYRFQS